MQSHLAPTERGGWVWGLPNVATGLPGGVEVSAGLSATTPRTSTDLTLSAKWSPLASRGSAVQVAVGAMAFMPMDGGSGPDRTRATAFPYVAVTAPVIPSLREASPVLTLAAYGVVRPRPGPFNDRRGVMIGVEQGLPPAIARAIGMEASQLQVSWVSGKTMFGYLNAGVTFVAGELNVSVGYARGNLVEFNHGPTFGIGWAF